MAAWKQYQDLWLKSYRYVLSCAFACIWRTHANEDFSITPSFEWDLQSRWAHFCTDACVCHFWFGLKLDCDFVFASFLKGPPPLTPSLTQQEMSNQANNDVHYKKQKVNFCTLYFVLEPAHNEWAPIMTLCHFTDLLGPRTTYLRYFVNLRYGNSSAYM